MVNGNRLQGIGQMLVALGILLAVGLYGQAQGQMGGHLGEKLKPRLITTIGARNAKCAAQSVETIAGTLGCTGARRAAKTSTIQTDSN